MATPAFATNGTLLHRQLFVTLRELIARGDYVVGDKLPTQETLCRNYGVSRITVRRALTDLQAEGLIRNEQGVGAFVESTPTSRSAPISTLSFVDGLTRVVEETTVELLSIDTAPCPGRIAGMLHLEAGRDAVRVMRIRRSKGSPVLFLESWAPLSAHKRITAAALRKRSLFSLLTRDGADVGRLIQEVNAELADAVTAKHLGVELNSPILRIERLLHDSKDQPLQYLSVRSTPLRTRMLMEISDVELKSRAPGHLLHDVGPGPQAPSARAPAGGRRRKG